MSDIKNGNSIGISKLDDKLRPILRLAFNAWASPQIANDQAFNAYYKTVINTLSYRELAALVCEKFPDETQPGLF
ncbi:MAG: hypothetical protein JNK10_09020 [Cyclobacteriaceae bacterium]|nr:hypothetical protein [Cyclobacteriaceae bacterium]